MTTTADDAPLRAGDLVWVDLSPTRGHEQAGTRPAVVLTNHDFHARNATAVVCAVTSNRRPWPTKVVLPDGLPVSGAVLVDQIRCVDRASRGFRRVGAVPAEVLSEIRTRLGVLLGIHVSPGP